mmetsp:Transcript_25684/g.60998  ORF Transcript_25684/g.60998 Transcript_25684/m.60998 type:complete len:130 (+) Transcript_25684:2-391(+)
MSPYPCVGSSTPSGRENSFSRSSTPDRQTASIYAQELQARIDQLQARNDRLNQAALSLLDSDWHRAVMAQEASNNKLTPTEQETFAPSKMLDIVKCFAQIGASHGLHAPELVRAMKRPLSTLSHGYMAQ